MVYLHTFIHSKPVDAALSMASKALEGHKSILDGLGKTRRLVESSIALGNWISLVHPVAQVAFAGLTAAYTVSTLVILYMFSELTSCS